MRVPGITYVQGRNGYSDPDGRKYAIAIHNTSNNASASAEASYATRRTDGTSSHFYCDSREVIQSLDTSVRAGHAGSSNGNNHAIAVEITGVNSWTRQQWLDRVAWDELGRVLAQVCHAYGISVRRATVAEMVRTPTVKAFYGHDDMRRAWGRTTHTDPGGNFPWDKLFQAVNAALHPAPAPAPATEETEEESAMFIVKRKGDATCYKVFGDGTKYLAMKNNDALNGLKAIGVKQTEVPDQAALDDVLAGAESVTPAS